MRSVSADCPDLPRLADSRPAAPARPDRPHPRAADRPAGGGHAHRLAVGPPAGPGPGPRPHSLLSLTLTRWRRNRGGYPGAAEDPGVRAMDHGGHDRAGPQPGARARRPRALADLTTSLPEGIRAHMNKVRERVPARRCCSNSTSPPARGAGGQRADRHRLDRLPPPIDAEAGLRAVADAARAFTVVHCCAPRDSFGMIKAAHAGGRVVLEVLLRAGGGRFRRERRGWAGDPRQRGLRHRLQARPTDGARLQPAVADPVVDLGRIGSASHVQRRQDSIAGQVVLTPPRPRAGASPGYARAALAHCREH